MKYIDAELLEAELKRLIKERDNMMKFGTYISTFYVYEDMLALIASLQQEIPEVDLEKEIEEQIDIYYNECEKKLNQMSDDSTDISFLTLNNFARHFYELGRLNARKKE